MQVSFDICILFFIIFIDKAYIPRGVLLFWLPYRQKAAVHHQVGIAVQASHTCILQVCDKAESPFSLHNHTVLHACPIGQATHHYR